jgi:hypothetical protein
VAGDGAVTLGDATRVLPALAGRHADHARRAPRDIVVGRARQGSRSRFVLAATVDKVTYAGREAFLPAAGPADAILRMCIGRIRISCGSGERCGCDAAGWLHAFDVRHAEPSCDERRRCRTR